MLFFLLSSGSMNKVRSRALARNCVNSKSPSRVPDGEMVVAESNKREQNSTIDEGPLIFHRGKSMIFLTKSKQK